MKLHHEILSFVERAWIHSIAVVNQLTCKIVSFLMQYVGNDI